MKRIVVLVFAGVFLFSGMTYATTIVPIDLDSWKTAAMTDNNGNVVADSVKLN